MAWGMVRVGPGNTSRRISKSFVSCFSVFDVLDAETVRRNSTSTVGCQTRDRRSDKERQRRLLTRTICDIRFARVFFPAWGKVGSEQKKKRHKPTQKPHISLSTHHTHHTNPTRLCDSRNGLPRHLIRWVTANFCFLPPHHRQAWRMLGGG